MQSEVSKLMKDTKSVFKPSYGQMHHYTSASLFIIILSLIITLKLNAIARSLRRLTNTCTKKHAKNRTLFFFSKKDMNTKDIHTTT